jgi:predicted DNA binding CopG/RHH family protein
MRKEYDFSNSVKNPYTKKMKKQITIRIDDDTIKYFKNIANELGMSYQNLINLYLSDCAEHQKKLKIGWK